MMVGLWLFNTNNADLNGHVEVGSQATSPGVPRSPSDVTREPKL
jgi:hypothetical protein